MTKSLCVCRYAWMNSTHKAPSWHFSTSIKSLEPSYVLSLQTSPTIFSHFPAEQHLAAPQSRLNEQAVDFLSLQNSCGLDLKSAVRSNKFDFLMAI